MSTNTCPYRQINTETYELQLLPVIGNKIIFLNIIRLNVVKLASFIADNDYDKKIVILRVNFHKNTVDYNFMTHFYRTRNYAVVILNLWKFSENHYLKTLTFRRVKNDNSELAIWTRTKLRTFFLER